MSPLDVSSLAISNYTRMGKNNSYYGNPPMNPTENETPAIDLDRQLKPDSNQQDPRFSQRHLYEELPNNSYNPPYTNSLQVDLRF